MKAAPSQCVAHSTMMRWVRNSIGIAVKQLLSDLTHSKCSVLLVLICPIHPRFIVHNMVADCACHAPMADVQLCKVVFALLWLWVSAIDLLWLVHYTWDQCFLNAFNCCLYVKIWCWLVRTSSVLLCDRKICGGNHNCVIPFLVAWQNGIENHQPAVLKHVCLLVWRLVSAHACCLCPAVPEAMCYSVLLVASWRWRCCLLLVKF